MYAAQNDSTPRAFSSSRSRHSVHLRSRSSPTASCKDTINTSSPVKKKQYAYDRASPHMQHDRHAALVRSVTWQCHGKLRGGYLEACEGSAILGVCPCPALMEEQLLWNAKNACCTAYATGSIRMRAEDTAGLSDMVKARHRPICMKIQSPTSSWNVSCSNERSSSSCEATIIGPL